MTTSTAIRRRLTVGGANRDPRKRTAEIDKPGSDKPGSDKPGSFQCAILRAFDLPKAYREVFLLKEIQGYTLAEIAAVLGISPDTALMRWKRARRNIRRPGDSDALEQLL